MEPDMMDTETPNYFSFLGRQAPKKKRKRGGLAGLWDRNKNIIKPVVSGALGLVNPALGAAAGAAMGGLDRPGKKGIGIDLGGAVRGGISGYGAGAAASALKGGVQGAMGAKGLDRLAAFGRGAQAGGQEYLKKPLMGRGPAPVTDVADDVLASAPKSALPFGGTTTGGRGLNRVLEFINANPNAVGMGLQAGASIIGAQEQRRIEEARQKEQRRQAENFARMALPLYLESFRGR